MRSIRNRLAIYFAIVIIVTVTLVEVLIIGVVRENYYKNLEASMLQQLKVSAELYSRYFSDTSLYDNVQNNVDTFWKQVDAQVQIIDLKGNILMDSIGIIPSGTINTQDVKDALAGKSGKWMGKVEYDDVKVMSIAYPLMTGDKKAGVLRFITSLREVNADMSRITSIIITIGVLVIIGTLILSFFLSFTIIEPLKVVTRAAEKMALGNFKINCPKKSNDEIGKLSDTLNYMAEEILKRDRLKNDFISSVSHELRTPLTSIKGWAITLNTPGNDEELIQDGLTIIEKESDRLTSMVEELLDFSRFVNGKIDLKSDPTDITNTVMHISKQMGPRAEREGIVFNVEVDKDMPRVMTDENKLKQVFINILDNSFRYTPSGGEVSLKAYINDDNLFFDIRDTGYGISQDELPHVKEKFFKGKNSKSKNGIGLSICDEIIKLMGGNFEIRSEVGKGTQTIISIPLVKV